MLKGVEVIANSDFIKAYIIKNYPNYPEITVIPRGFDPVNRFNIKTADGEKVRKKHNIGEKTPIILTVGRFTRWKGQHIFLESLQHLKTDKYVVLIYGDSNKQSEYTNELNELAENKNITGRVVFCGSKDELSDYYKAATITVSPSIKPEAFGRIAVESQGMGTPIIATNHGGSLETIKNGETGWLIPHSDPKAMALAIDKALSNPKLAEMGKNAYNWAMSRFTIDKMCAGEFEIYKKILGL